MDEQERVVGNMSEPKKVNDPKDSTEMKAMETVMMDLVELLNASVKIAANFSKMPKEELTADEKDFMDKVAKAGLSSLLLALVCKK